MNSKDGIHQGVEIRSPRTVQPKDISIKHATFQQERGSHHFLAGIGDKTSQPMEEKKVDAEIQPQQEQRGQQVWTNVIKASEWEFGRRVQGEWSSAGYFPPPVPQQISAPFIIRAAAEGPGARRTLPSRVVRVLPVSTARRSDCSVQPSYLGCVMTG
jgi:hypothetical protein